MYSMTKFNKRNKLKKNIILIQSLGVAVYTNPKLKLKQARTFN